MSTRKHSPLELLKSNKPAEIQSKKGQKLISCLSSDLLPTVLQKLVDYRILSVPVFDSRTNAFIGLVDFLDLVHFLAEHHWKVLEHPKSYREADIFVSFNEKTAKDVMGVSVAHKPDWNEIHKRYGLSEDATFADVAKVFTETGLRRVPLFNSERNVNHIVTQSEIVHFLYEHMEDIDGKFLLKKVQDISHTKDVVSVPADCKAIEAFRVITGQGVSAVPVVANCSPGTGADVPRMLLATISVRDVRLMGTDASAVKNLYDYTALEYAKLCRERTDNMALTPAVSCSTDDYLEDVLVKMNESKIHRIWVSDPGTKILRGVVALKDIISEARQGV
ncbi:hypothetical protein BJ742DRAFT_889796 [Cladochytrium replicatum]|nr:hypothetical protein BJ742DRAFT_889796 [Cladochytrium replicatum]